MSNEAIYKAAIERAQAILTRHLAPDGPSKADTIQALLQELDSRELVSHIRPEPECAEDANPSFEVYRRQRAALQAAQEWLEGWASAEPQLTMIRDALALTPPVLNMRPEIQLSSGIYFDLLSPMQARYSLRDIAHGLSNVCRFGGHTGWFYSVAQHSVLVSRIVPPALAFQALFHDAAEALIGDVPSPLKQLLPDYRRIERDVEAAVRTHLGLPVELHPAIKAADLVALATERRDLMPFDGIRWPIIAKVTPLPDRIEPLPPLAALDLFLERLAEIPEADHLSAHTRFGMKLQPDPCP